MHIWLELRQWDVRQKIRVLKLLSPSVVHKSRISSILDLHLIERCSYAFTYILYINVKNTWMKRNWDLRACWAFGCSKFSHPTIRQIPGGFSLELPWGNISPSLVQWDPATSEPLFFGCGTVRSSQRLYNSQSTARDNTCSEVLWKYV